MHAWSEEQPSGRVWNEIKRGELKHRYCHDLDMLRLALHRAKARLHYMPTIICKCSTHRGY